MKDCYGMLKDLVMEYHSTYFPYVSSEITSVEKANETKEIIKRLDSLKEQIFTFAMLYVDEREGIKNDL